MLRLNDQYENHSNVEEFTKGCNVMSVYETYLLEGEADGKFSLCGIWNLSQQLLQANDKLYESVELHTKALDFSLNTEMIKQIHGLMMEDEKDVLAGEYRKSPVFAGYHIFAPAGHVERYMDNKIFRFHENKKDDPIMAATNLFGNVINIHPFKDENGRICHLILAHVLIQMKSCLFLVILSSFHRRGRRHYIRAVKMFDRKRSMLYTIIVNSLIHCWHSFEQSAGITMPGPKI